MLGADEMAEYEEARAASQRLPTPPAFTLVYFRLWLAMLTAIVEERADARHFC